MKTKCNVCNRITHHSSETWVEPRVCVTCRCTIIPEYIPVEHHIQYLTLFGKKCRENHDRQEKFTKRNS